MGDALLEEVSAVMLSDGGGTAEGKKREESNSVKSKHNSNKEVFEFEL